MATDDDVRRICLSLPETSELLSAGVPFFRVARRGFAKLRQQPAGLMVYTPSVADKEAMLSSAPEKFFTIAHYDGEPNVLIHVGAVDVDELTELLTTSWRLRAPEELKDTVGKTGTVS